MGHAKLVSENPGRYYPSFLRDVSIAKDGEITGEPIVVQMDSEGSLSELKAICSTYEKIEVIDNYAEQYAELLLSKNAHLYRANYQVQVASIRDLLAAHYDGRKPWRLGSWVYFPWKNQLVHILAQHEFETLRTIRNRELITAEEQEVLLGFRVAAFGMSVGSAGALAMAVSGISRKIKLVDGAVISGSNLNRILTGVSSVGKSKALTIGQQVYEMNPYSTVAYYDRATKDNIGTILDTPWQIDLAVDEIDDIETKVRIRYEARRRKIPVVMATEIGDTIILDVERFDLEPDRPLLHNMIPNLETILEKSVVNYREWTKHAMNIIGPDNMTIKVQKSLLKIGTTVVTHPQLGSTVMITGGVLAFAAKSIAAGGALKSGRYIVSLERELLADHRTRRYRKQHKQHTKMLRKAVESM